MGDPFPENGRVTAGVIHNDIQALRGEVRAGFARVDGSFMRFDERVRRLEIEAAKDDGKDVAVAAAKRAATTAAVNAGESKRWLVALSVGVVVSIVTTFVAAFLR